MPESGETFAAGERQRRSPADACALLVELGRAVHASRFYPQGHPSRDEALERCQRAWEADLSRLGPLDLELRRGGFWLAGEAEPVGRGRLDELARTFVVRAIQRLRVEPGFAAEGLQALIELLASDPEEIERSGGPEQVFYRTSRPGFQINRADYGVLAGQASAAPDTEAGARAAGPAAPEVELAPLEAATSGSGADELVALLRELDACRDDERYAGLACRVVEVAYGLAQGGAFDEGYRAALVLAAHASDEASRPVSQREIASGALRQLATDAVLDDLVARACAPGVEASLRATQILLELGEHVVPALFERLEAEASRERRQALEGILIAMGEAATPKLIEAIDSGEPARVRLAVRLAGESQNPRAVPALSRLLEHRERAIRHEAARALVQIASPDAIEALVATLSSPLEDAAAFAAYCLGASGRPETAAPLVQTLERSMRTGKFELAREAIRALGRLGRSSAAPALVRVLRKRTLLHRRRLRPLQLAAAAALARLPGDEAREALERAARSRDAQLRSAAAQALRRRPSDVEAA